MFPENVGIVDAFYLFWASKTSAKCFMLVRQTISSLMCYYHQQDGILITKEHCGLWAILGCFGLSIANMKMVYDL